MALPGLLAPREGSGLWGSSPSASSAFDWSSLGGLLATSSAAGFGKGGGGGGAATPPEPSDAASSSEPEPHPFDEAFDAVDLRDLLTVDLLDEVAGGLPGSLGSDGGRPRLARLPGSLGSDCGEQPGDTAGADQAGGAATANAPAPKRSPRPQPGAPRRPHDPDATEFLFHLVTSAHEDAYEAARGEAGAGYRRQIAAEAVEAIEKLGADPAGCDAEAEDGAPITLLTLLFQLGNDYGGHRSKVGCVCMHMRWGGGLGHMHAG